MNSPHSDAMAPPSRRRNPATSLFRTKSVEASLAETQEAEYQLKKRLTAVDLTVFGIGVIIGAGIFTITGPAARDLAGPAVTLSFVVAGVACALAALCYAEFASAVPVSGSAYTFSYAALGEVVAWIIGWDLIMEMMLAAGVVAKAWSGYLSTFLGHFNVHLPSSISSGSHVDLPAFFLVAALTALVVFGIKESLRVNLVLVAVKLFVVLFVIFAGLQFINPANYVPFIPPAEPAALQDKAWNQVPVLQLLLGSAPSSYGLMGIVSGAALVFFAYIGFDVVATTAEEAENPQRDLPIGIIASLTICTVLYIAVSLVLTGMVPFHEISKQAALATAFEHVGRGGYATLISAGAVAGLTTVTLTMLIGASRICFAMSRDWLLPRSLARTHPTSGVPVRINLIIGAVVAAVATFTPVGVLEEMVNIGTLLAFALVSLTVPVLRKRRPDLHRPFRMPGSPVLPVAAALCCVYLTLNLSFDTWVRFVSWMVIGMAIYGFYGRSRSRLALHPEMVAPSWTEMRAQRAVETSVGDGPVTGSGVAQPRSGRSRARDRSHSDRR